ncbi:MAG: AAA family ATPase [Tannerellaceae bacterium]
MIESISSFAISYAAGAVFDLWKNSNATVDKEIKEAFDEALIKWCPNSDIREIERGKIRKGFLEIAKQPHCFTDNYDCYGPYQEFYTIFNKVLPQYQTAFNYISSIHDEERYIKEAQILSKIESTVVDTNEKITAICKLLENGESTSVKINTNRPKPPLRSVLFNNYSKDVDEFYLVRDIDSTFLANFKSANLWIYGSSGIGKTALINRNLIKNSVEYIYCDFSPIDISCSDDILNEIISNIIEKYNLEFPGQSSNLIKDVSNLLSAIKINNIVIVIDELSIRDSMMLRNITEQLIRLINFHCNKSGQNQIRFIASTINKPIFDESYAGKLLEHFEIIEVTNWNDDLKDLLILLENHLDITTNDSIKSIILTNSKSSPRLLKKILRKLHTLGTINERNVEDISVTVANEHF